MTKAGEALALFVTGKDVSHHVRRVVLDFIPRIEREATADLDRLRAAPLDEDRLARALFAIHAYGSLDEAREIVRDIAREYAALGDRAAEGWYAEGVRLSNEADAARKPALGDRAAEGDGYVTCGIDGCEFAVERGEGRTMALHQSEGHEDRAAEEGR